MVGILSTCSKSCWEFIKKKKRKKLLGVECGVLFLFDMFILLNLEANCGLLGFCVIILIVNFEYGYTKITRSLNILTELIVISCWLTSPSKLDKSLNLLSHSLIPHQMKGKHFGKQAANNFMIN